MPEADIRDRRFSPAFRELLKFECERAQELFTEGLKLLPLVDRRLRLDVEMFSRGGQEILRMIAAKDYDVLTKRPSIPKRRQIAMLFSRLLAGFLPRN